MKKVVIISIMCMLAMATTAQKKEKTKEKTDVTFHVPMDCHGCIIKINNNISFEKGVKRIECNLEQKTVVVTYRTDQTNIDSLKNAFKRIGYKDVYVIGKDDDSGSARE
jgi:copper chaperone CopZ